MTTIEINDQIKVIQQATKTAMKSKSSAMKFLVDAGIIKPETAKKSKAKQ